MGSEHFLRLATLSGHGKLAAAARHNKRAIQRELGASGHIDPCKTALNYCICGETTPEAIGAKAKALREALGITKLRKNAVQAIEVIFSLPSQAPIDTRQYFNDCCDWLAKAMGAQNILAADVHHDEAQPHCHVLLLPIKDGKMAGAAIMGNMRTMYERQSAFYEAVPKRYGLAMTQRRRVSLKERQTLSKAILGHLRASNDPALKSQGWPVIRDQIEQAPQLWANCLGLDLPTGQPKKQRTMAQIFTSKGRGKSTESEPRFVPSKPATQNPIGDVATKDIKPYALLGV
jgi:hypothetical protein